MPFVRSQLNTKLRNIQVSDIIKRGSLVSPEEATRLSTIIESSSHSVPFFDGIQLSDILNPNEINQAFDFIWVDHSILIEDMAILYETYKKVLEKTKERLVVPRLQIKEAISTTRNYLKLKGYESFYNLVKAFYMGTAKNEEKINVKLTVDKESGILHLPISKETRYSSEADMNISFSLISKGCKIVEQSDDFFLFDSDLTWYLNAVAERLNNPTPYNTYNGILLAVDITLPAVVNVNTIKIRLVSDVAEEIVDVLYAPNYSDALAETTIPEYSITNNGFITDISFEPVFTRKLRIVVGSKLVREAETDIIIDNILADDYERKVTDEISKIEVDYYLLDTTASETEIRTRVRDALFKQPIEIKKTRKLYSIPIRTIEVLNREYQAYGSFSSSGTLLEGNLAFIAMEEEVVNSNGIRVVKKAIINGAEYSLGSVDEDGYVNDITAVKIGNIDDRNKTYSFTTNFIPLDDSAIEVTAFGEALDPANINFALAEKLQTGTRYYLSASSDIVEGTTLTLKYKPALYDRAGIVYDPRKLDIIVSLGKPNTKNNLIANRVGQDIYFYESATTISRYPISEVSRYNDTFRTPVDNSGNPKNGESNSIGNIFWNGTSGYVELNVRTYGPYRGSYILIQEEKNVDSNGFLEAIGNSSLKGTTEPYVRGMIQVFQGTAPAVISSEYDTRFGAVDDFKRVVIDRTSIDPSKPVRVYYHPLPKFNGTFDSTTLNNIERPNETQNLVTNQPVKEIILNRYPFIDPDILFSSLFTKNRGTWFFKDRTSVIYEPIIIYIDRKKLEYGNDFTLSGKKISFKDPVTGNINIRYYVLADRVGFKIEMYREEPLKVGNTARVLSLLALGKVVK